MPREKRKKQKESESGSDVEEIQLTPKPKKSGKKATNEESSSKKKSKAKENNYIRVDSVTATPLSKTTVSQSPKFQSSISPQISLPSYKPLPDSEIPLDVEKAISPIMDPITFQKAASVTWSIPWVTTGDSMDHYKNLISKLPGYELIAKQFAKQFQDYNKRSLDFDGFLEDRDSDNISTSNLENLVEQAPVIIVHLKNVAKGKYRRVTTAGVKTLLQAIAKCKAGKPDTDGFLYFSHITLMTHSLKNVRFFTNVDGNHRSHAFMDYHHLYAWPCKILPPLPRRIFNQLSESANRKHDDMAVHICEFEKALRIDSLLQNPVYSSPRGIQWDKLVASEHLDKLMYPIDGIKKSHSTISAIKSKPNSWDFLLKQYDELGPAIDTPFALSKFNYAEFRKLNDQHMLKILSDSFKNSTFTSNREKVRAYAGILAHREAMVESIQTATTKYPITTYSDLLIERVNNGGFDLEEDTSVFKNIMSLASKPDAFGAAVNSVSKEGSIAFVD